MNEINASYPSLITLNMKLNSRFIIINLGYSDVRTVMTLHFHWDILLIVCVCEMKSIGKFHFTNREGLH